jgi:hypothetical protein
MLVLHSCIYTTGTQGHTHMSTQIVCSKLLIVDCNMSVLLRVVLDKTLFTRLGCVLTVFML